MSALAKHQSKTKMAEDLLSRDKIGVQDAVLLENYTDQAEFIQNLNKRHMSSIPYTYIGQNIVSVNPYKQLDIYSENSMKAYHNVNFYELPPHIFALSDTAYRTMTSQNVSQCILISGESGSGKTENSKYILQYLTKIKYSKESDNIKNRLINSNPLLEAFGNAKTQRNDNSSRFGKYMDVEFDYKGLPVGGHIINYLLEKARVVQQHSQERNFHIFYHLLSDSNFCQKFDLPYQNASEFKILTGDVNNSNDNKNFKEVLAAMDGSGFSENEKEDLLKIIAAVLYLGNVEFTTSEEGSGQDGEVSEISSNPSSQEAVEKCAKLLGINIDDLSNALTKRTIAAGTKQIETNLNVQQAEYAREAMVKSLYSKSFDWLVQRINKSLQVGIENRKKSLRNVSSRNVIGLLDIYGFEIFEKNLFEQVCINFCNEKLQQLFVQLTLKQEQEEYKTEQIQWEPVEYFDNRPICSLIEGKTGLINILDEECRLPGNTSDMTFLAKCENVFGNRSNESNKFFSTFNLMTSSADRKNIARNQFIIKHYAGDVTYDVDGFLDKNNDTVFRDLKATIASSNNFIAKDFFSVEEIRRKKQPETASTQFKNSLNTLMDILISKEPSYIRCIKPNEWKMSSRFDEDLVAHQVKYLGLMENLRIRRAGFAYRRLFTEFIKRYKAISKETWPSWHGPNKEGAGHIMSAMGFTDDEYKLGKTKIFIRHPKSLFALETKLMERKNELATKLQANYKGYAQKKKFGQLKEAQVTFSKYYRGRLDRIKAEERKKAATDLRKFVKGFIQRHQAVNDENRYFVQQVRLNYLKKVKENLPDSILRRDNWPECPPNCLELKSGLKNIWERNWLNDYCKSMTVSDQARMEEKYQASCLFKNKRADYSESVASPFLKSRTGMQMPDVLGATPIYKCEALKVDNKGVKRPFQLLCI